MAAAGNLSIAPVGRPVVMLIETRLVVTIEKACLVVFGAGSYLFLGKIDVNSRVGLDHVIDPLR